MIGFAIAFFTGLVIIIFVKRRRPDLFPIARVVSMLRLSAPEPKPEPVKKPKPVKKKKPKRRPFSKGRYEAYAAFTTAALSFSDRYPRRDRDEIDMHKLRMGRSIVSLWASDEVMDKIDAFIKAVASRASRASQFKRDTHSTQASQRTKT